MSNLGIIEGYFGRCWTWRERRAVIDKLAPAGYRFFHYAPKIDMKLRRHWDQPYTSEELDAIASFSDYCVSSGIRFGVGLTPYGAHLDFSAGAKAALKGKLNQLDEAGISDLAILFDDMDGDLPDLAQRQADIMSFAADYTRATDLFLCPSYYSDDAVLDRVFGARPEGYLEDLGRLVDRKVAIYWTGEEVCSREFGAGHLQNVAERLGRLPALWDNYPVNDGPRMSQFLHLRAFTGRSPCLSDLVSHHAINPMSQPILGCIPALTLPMAYSLGDSYAYGAAFTDAAKLVCGDKLADALLANLLMFNDSGLERIAEETKAKLQALYGAIDHPAAREVCDWLGGAYAITGEMLQTQ
jgi:hypothetical protein